MRKEVLGSLFILVVMVASAFTFLIPGQQGNGGADLGRPLQLYVDVAGWKDAAAMVPSNAVTMLFTDAGNDTDAQLVAWAAAVTGLPSDGLFGRPVGWFAQATYPGTQGASQLDTVDHWVQLLSYGNSSIYDYPNVQPAYRGINVTRHPNFYYTPNTEPMVISVQREDLYSVVDILLQSGTPANTTAAVEYAGLLAGLPDDAGWAFLVRYSNLTGPLGFADQVGVTVTPLGGGEYGFNLSARVRQGAQPDAAAFATPLNATGNASFTVAGGYALYGVRGGIEVVSSELFRLGVFTFRG